MKTIIIAAVSARPFARAAAGAGYDVICLDAFADVDTCSAARQVFRMDYVQGRFEPDSFMKALNGLEVGIDTGLVYGSGFETTPQLLEAVGQSVHVIGNTPQVLRNLKRPRQFFMLLDILKIPHPEVSFRPLDNAAGWLYKQGGGSGGTHIHKALPLPGIGPKQGHYFQREIRGIPVSLLFAANGKQSKAVGFNELWMAPTPAMPYRYGGAVSHAELPDAVRHQLVQIAQQLTNAVGLRGLNSLDAIVEDDQVYVLEVNPRLTATFDLYQCHTPATSGADLFELHMQACAGNLGDWLQITPVAKAHHVAYAPFALRLPAAMEWPEWAADIPQPGSYIAADNPLCTILAESETPVFARELVLAREGMLRDIIGQYQLAN